MPVRILCSTVCMAFYCLGYSRKELARIFHNLFATESMSTRELARISEQKENQVTCLQKLIERGCASSTLNIRRHI
ncbi:Hypothetical protein PHPALM_15738 [Phytophthora palmivora]|uniref:Uncharacterized protein n=1 Tax=Phytophthora palmivora TaxID=4796 RepID=A0A2P4XRM1_9STRA|nr:Hypothetical protein PHPALM_15738 [Phytophthora palmivora]